MLDIKKKKSIFANQISNNMQRTTFNKSATYPSNHTSFVRKYYRILPGHTNLSYNHPFKKQIQSV